jgi:hypothetical protein
MSPTLIRSVVLTSCISLAGCTTLTASPWGAGSRNSPSGAAGDHGEMVGATVVVRTIDGKEIEARVTAIDEHKIELVQATTGESMTLTPDNVASLSRKEFSVQRTVLLVAGVVAVVYLIRGYLIVKGLDRVYASGI